MERKEQIRRALLAAKQRPFVAGTAEEGARGAFLTDHDINYLLALLRGTDPEETPRGKLPQLILTDRIRCGPPGCGWEGEIRQCRREDSEFLDEATFYLCPQCGIPMVMQRGEDMTNVGKITIVLSTS